MRILSTAHRPGERLMTRSEAANYLGLDEMVLRNQLIQRRGPKHLQVSPRRQYFRRSDLDSWMLSWDEAERRPNDPCI